MNLDLEEEYEWSEHKSSGAIVGLSERFFHLRWRIAHKLCAYILRVDDTLSEEQRELYRVWPMCGFYVDKHSGSNPRRVFAIRGFKQGEWYLRSYKADRGFVQEESVPTSRIRRVNQWSPANLEVIHRCSRPGIFIDPLGFFEAIKDNVTA